MGAGFDFFFLLQVLISTLVLLKFANTATDAVAFYCLPNGKSTVLRNKRQEVVSKRSEFAEIGTLEIRHPSLSRDSSLLLIEHPA